ncbi:MPE1-like protein [Purpureocillium lavendulum]|uniref:MPE1-like protein n=1 Tax=Purpureocillium lavendulum TaxID=1247861 RepID=A0AB34FVD0_9HYPO|nr:MPE1-like protein [Purpureocillium lavendulum]
MSSSVFFKFKSQKEPTRVEFDGTGISVFELKREIITKSGLGDGTDFDLYIYTDDNSQGECGPTRPSTTRPLIDGSEYDDDTTIVPRSTTVIARRQPAAKPGAGRAARYVSGKMPVSAKNAGRKEQAAKASAAKPSNNAINQMNAAMTEEEKMAAMFAAQSEQWSAQQEEMSHQAPVFKPGAKRPANVPDHDPPNGYICYRCGNKGHWIQLCPTNDDPDFDNRPRVKRTTGIPRSFLQKVDKSVVLAQTEGDESKRPSGIMVNAEGDFVIAEPDKASWEQFQAKTKSSTANKETQAENKEVQERGLECSIDKKMFIEPMKTPCCKKTFCNDCITNALIETDFVCPSCQTEGVLIDDLTPDEDMAKQIQDYLKEKETAKSSQPSSPKPEADNADTAEDKVEGKEEGKTEQEEEDKAEKADGNEETAKENSQSPTPNPATPASPPKGPKALTQANDQKEPQAEGNPRKRPADDFLENPKIPKGPKAMQNQQNQQNMMPNAMSGMPNMGMNNMMFNGMGMMPNMMGMPNMNMNMGMPMMGMPMMGMGMNDFGMNAGGYGAMGNMGNMGNMGFNGMPGMNNMGNMGMQQGPNMGGMGGMGPMNGFQNGGNFSQQNNAGDEDAYFRKPVNPHRHQNKQRRVRPSDYREL